MKTLNARALLFIIFLSIQVALCQPSLEQAIRFFNDGKLKNAKPLFEQILNNEPKNSKALFYLGTIYLSSNDYENAIEYLEKALEIEPMNGQYCSMLGGAYGIKALQAGVFKKLGAVSDCKKYLLKAVELAPDSIEYRIDLLQFYLEAPGIMGGSVDKAKNQANTISKLDPFRGYMAHATIYRYEEKQKEVEECYNKAIALDPKRPDGYRILWAFYLEQKDETKANRAFQNALDVTKDKTNLYYEAGLRYITDKKYESAKENLFNILKLDSTRISAYYQLGKISLLTGQDLDLGIRYFEKYLNVEPKPRDPSWAHAHWRMGMIYEKLGKKNQAKAEYQKTLQLNPELEEAKKALEELD